MMPFDLEKGEDVVHELIQFIKVHHDEAGTLTDGEFAPNISRYLEMDRLGHMRIYTVRVEEKLVGYCVVYIFPHLHYSQTKWAQQDLLFIQKKYRGVRSYRFIEWVDDQLRQEGVEVVLRSVTNGNDYSRLLKFQGYEENSVNYMRRL